jgi:eukaryotic-like serine/threonine-protein kinase
MTIAPGTHLGPYSIAALLGAGGMGEVYRARDTRLGRDVAIKVLSADRSAKPEARARFEAEARMVSALNHPHICTLYDVGRQEDTYYLVMELLEGETLAERLARGPLPIPEALKIGIQILDALDRAHRSGMVHRDLKPGNIMLTRSGAKLMDFGLARATALSGLATLSGSGEEFAESPTLDTPLTAHGTIVGTLQYLAPEQLEGKEADARSDLWAVGCMLYEMAAGRRTFVASSPASLIAAIIEREPPPPVTLAGKGPPGFERAVMRCLAKDPDQRWQSASDLRSELEWIAEGGPEKPVPASAGRGRPRIGWMLAAALATVAAVGLTFVSRSSHGPEPLSFRQLNFRREAVFQAAFEPGGETVVYSAAREGNTPRIFTVRPEYPEPQPLGPPGMHLLALSSRGELAVLLGAHYVWHRLFTGTLARMPLGGGAPREILEGVRQADWSPDGSELAIIHEVAGTDRLEYPIGRVLREASGYMTDVRVSPRGDRVAFFEHPRKWDDRGSVNVVDLEGKRTVLSDGYWSARGLAWAPDGEEILFSASLSGGSYTVYGVTLDGKRRVVYQPPGGLIIQDVARDGRWLATRADYRYAAMVHTPAAPGDRDLSWLNTSHARSLSQDGQTLLFAETSVGTNYAVCLRKTDGSPVVRLGDGWPADLSADGASVLAVIQTRPPQLVIYPTGAGQTRRLERGGIENYATAQWFPDGRRVLVNGNEPGKGTRFYVQDVEGGPPRPVTPEGTRDGLLSRDGKVVLARGPGESYSLYPIAGGEPRPAPGLGVDDIVAKWSADGRSVLAYRRAEIPCRVERVFFASGERQPVEELAPSERAGLLSLRDVYLTDDLRSYAYTAYYRVSSLFVSERGR